MTYSMDQIKVNAFHAMLHHLAVAKGGKLRGLFPTETAKGEKHFFDRMGQGEVSIIEGRNVPITHDDSPFSRRMATLVGSMKASLVYDMEKMIQLIDPTADVVREHLDAHGRNFDATIFNAMLGTAATGVGGAGTQAFDSNQVIAAAATGLTVSKLLDAITLLENGNVDVDNEKIFLFLSPNGKNDLLNDVKFTSSDYQNIHPLAGGMPMFRGICNIVTSNLIPQIDASNFRALLVAESAVKVAYGIQPKVSIDQIVTIKNLPFQIYSEEFFGAVRMEEAKIVDIRFV